MERAKSENVKNVFMVVSSNVLTIVVLLLIGFLLPKELSIPDYAYYRGYVLYIAYAGFFHLGLVNGIYLEYGNLDASQLPKKEFRAYGRFMLFLQAAAVAVLSLLLFAASFFMETEKTVMFAFVIVNIPLVNIKWFYSSINQFTKRFAADSRVTYFQNLLSLVMVGSVILFHWYDFQWILAFTTAQNFICMVIVMWQNREIVAGEAARWRETPIAPMAKSGFFLMLSEFVGILILSIDSVFVDNLFSQTEFAMYTFAVSVISVIFMLITTVSNLVYPYLVRARREKYAEYYTRMSDVLAVLCLFSLLAFYVAEFIIRHWLENYVPSIRIVSILFGTVLFRTIITLVCGNYFKVLKMIPEYTKNNIFAIGISFAANVAACLIAHDYRLIAVASLFSFAVWYLVTDRVFIKKLGIPLRDCAPRYCCIALCYAAFYLTAGMRPVPAFFLYAAAASASFLLCYGKQLAQGLREMRVSGAGNGPRGR